MPGTEFFQSIAFSCSFVFVAVGFCSKYGDVGVPFEVVGRPFVELFLPVFQGVDRSDDQDLLIG